MKMVVHIFLQVRHLFKGQTFYLKGLFHFKKSQPLWEGSVSFWQRKCRVNFDCVDSSCFLWISSLTSHISTIKSKEQSLSSKCGCLNFQISTGCQESPSPAECKCLNGRCCVLEQGQASREWDSPPEQWRLPETTLVDAELVWR